MNIALWILQIILAIKLLTTAFTHGRPSSQKMQAAIQRSGASARPLLLVSAGITLLGALGLILPGVLHAAAWITPLTALVIFAFLLASIFLHSYCREKPNIYVSVILFTFALMIAYGRWFIAPL